MNTFEINETFELNGKPFKIISGAMHYFRIVPEYWRDRLEKLKAMGCNTVETYIAWNVHEENKGQFVWDGMADFEKFISIAQELGLYVICRPGPYICSEWELGGLPAWLLAEPGMKLRCMYSPYIEYVNRYFGELIPRLVPHQIDHGGNIILFQVENEYGYYGNNKLYLKYLANLMRSLGVTVPFVTSDGPWGNAFKCGQIEEALPTANFGSAAKIQFDLIKKQMPKKKPMMCMEFWAGWFDAWGNRNHKTSPLKINKLDFDYLVKKHNVNIYMFHGGTNFGFMNGSNYYKKLTPDTTSYDYDAPLSEDGLITPKYRAFKEIIEKYQEVPAVQFSTPIKRIAYGVLNAESSVGLWQNLDKISSGMEYEYPVSMEETGQNYGYILYRTKLSDWEKTFDIEIEQASDRVQVYSEGSHLYTLYDKETTKKVFASIKGNSNLDFLVENMGRVNFAHYLEEQKKGIQKGVKINGHRKFGWQIFNLPLDKNQFAKIDSLLDENKDQKTKINKEEPSFTKFTFDIEETGDTFLDFTGWGKGCAFVNGFNIGRFWDKGPQKRLYIPGPLLHKGQNSIVIFETEGKHKNTIELKDEHKLQ